MLLRRRLVGRRCGSWSCREGWEGEGGYVIGGLGLLRLGGKGLVFGERRE